MSRNTKESGNFCGNPPLVDSDSVSNSSVQRSGQHQARDQFQLVAVGTIFDQPLDSTLQRTCAECWIVTHAHQVLHCRFGEFEI